MKKMQLPTYMEKTDAHLGGAPENSETYIFHEEHFEGFAVFSPLAANDVLPTDLHTLIPRVQAELPENGALIYASPGYTAGNTRCVAVIAKLKNEETLGTDYMLTIQLLDEEMMELQALFSEIGDVGYRDKAVYANTGFDNVTPWTEDPYTGETGGFALSRGEQIQYDMLFPEHPLTKAREFMWVVTGY